MGFFIRASNRIGERLEKSRKAYEEFKASKGVQETKRGLKPLKNAIGNLSENVRKMEKESRENERFMGADTGFGFPQKKKKGRKDNPYGGDYY